jgi:hypothetical protein
MIDRPFRDDTYLKPRVIVLDSVLEKCEEVQAPWPAVKQVKRYAKQVAFLEHLGLLVTAVRIERSFECFKTQFEDWDTRYQLAKLYQRTHWTWHVHLKEGDKE